MKVTGTSSLVAAAVAVSAPFAHAFSSNIGTACTARNLPSLLQANNVPHQPLNGTEVFGDIGLSSSTFKAGTVSRVTVSVPVTATKGFMLYCEDTKNLGQAVGRWQVPSSSYRTSCNDATVGHADASATKTGGAFVLEIPVGIQGNLSCVAAAYPQGAGGVYVKTFSMSPQTTTPQDPNATPVATLAPPATEPPTTVPPTTEPPTTQPPTTQAPTTQAPTTSAPITTSAPPTTNTPTQSSDGLGADGDSSSGAELITVNVAAGPLAALLAVALSVAVYF